MPISPDFQSVFQRDFTIEFTQCYPGGNLRYTDLCDLLQLTAGSHADTGGISFSDMQRHHQAWVLSQMRLEIHRMPRWKEKVTVTTWIVSLENSRSVRALEISAGEEKVVGCETFWAVFNTETRRPQALALPHEHFEKFPDRLSTMHRTKRINTAFEPATRTSYQVRLSDLDIVNHANHVKYLEWCLDEWSAFGAPIRNIDMNFTNEVALGDVVEMVQGQENDTTRFAIGREGKLCFALELTK